MASASDLAGMEQPLAQAFRTATGKQIEMVFAASGMLARQIEQGAPFDVYLSANEDYVKQLVESGKLDPATVAVYAVGRLGLWSKEGSFNDLKQLTAGSVRHIAIA
ncbi:MAG: molybdate ABC transporter substrate-binding protein, partial [bacterium]